VGQLTGTVGPEVGVDDGIAALEAAARPDHRGGHELIGLAERIGGFDGGRGARRVAGGLAMDDRVVAGLDPLPAVVAIHREVATADRCDAGVRMGGDQTRLQVADETQATRGRGIAPIEQRVDSDPRDPLASRELGEGDDVPVVGVDATRTDQTDDVQRAPSAPRVLARRDERRPGRERSVIDRGIDPRQVLEHRAARAEVEVADLRVAHLSGRQPDRSFRGAQGAVGPRLDEVPPDRHGRSSDRVAGRIATDPEAVEHDEDDGSRPGPRPAPEVGHEAVSRPARGPGR
jgi:hypothetical protein